MKNLKILVSYTLIMACLILTIMISRGCTGTLPPNTSLPEDNRFLELLGLLPESAKHSGGFAVIDYEKIWQDNDITLLTPDGQNVKQKEFLDGILARIKDDSLTGLDSMILGSYYTGFGIYMFASAIQEKNIGYDLTYVKAEINIFDIRSYIDPREEVFFSPDFMVAAIGRYNPQATNDTLENRSEWPSWAVENYMTENYGDITIHSWRDGKEAHFNTVLSPPHINDMGQARPLAVSDGRLFVGNSVEDVKSMIDTYLKKSRSLGDVPEYAMVAKAMYELDAYGGIIAHEVLANGNPGIITVHKTPRLKKFITFGTGPGRDENGNYIVLVLVHDDQDTAIANVSLLKQKIENLTWDGQALSDVIYDVEICTEGKVLLAKLYTNMETIAPLWFLKQGTILLHEY